MRVKDYYFDAWDPLGCHRINESVLHEPAKVCPKVPYDRAEFCCEARKENSNWVARDAKAGVEVCYTEAPIPGDQEDNSPIHGNGELSDQVARSLLRQKFEPERHRVP